MVRASTGVLAKASADGHHRAIRGHAAVLADDRHVPIAIAGRFNCLNLRAESDRVAKSESSETMRSDSTMTDVLTSLRLSLVCATAATWGRRFRER